MLIMYIILKLYNINFRNIICTILCVYREDVSLCRIRTGLFSLSCRFIHEIVAGVSLRMIITPSGGA